MPRESGIVDRIVKRLRARGAVVRKRHGTAFGIAGDPDLYGSFLGRHFEIEVKAPGGEPTAIQRKRLDEWLDCGAMTGVATSPEEALLILGGIISWVDQRKP